MILDYEGRSQKTTEELITAAQNYAFIFKPKATTVKYLPVTCKTCLGNTLFGSAASRHREKTNIDMKIFADRSLETRKLGLLEVMEKSSIRNQKVAQCN